jgi:glycosyltransferase involved in cell wall biosynthesis
MSIVIFGDIFSFPEGDAATNRVYTYANGFIENGIRTDVVTIGNEYNSFASGITNGISYYNAFGQKERNNNFVIRNSQKLLKYFKAIRIFRRINKEEKISAIIIFTNFLMTHLFGWFLSKICNAKLLIECSENPLRFYQNGALNRRIGVIKFYIESYFCDGVFCISRFLLEFYKERGISQKKLFIVHCTADPDRFAQPVEKPVPYSYIGYFGGLTFKRDNIEILFRAFALISDKHPDIHLVVGGVGTDDERNQIRSLIKDLGISSKAVLLDFLSRSEIVRYIVHSDILVMVRGKDMESQASFPSKLTEYLSTSKPVVSVNVGEISDYLTDGVNSFLVEPENYVALAEKLDYVLNNYESALEIAKRGKELTSTIFNYNYQAKRIIQYIETL